MKEKSTADMVVGPEIFKLAPGDPFLDQSREIDELVANRAYRLFQDRGCVHGFDREDWLRAQSEIVADITASFLETDSEILIRAYVPGFRENDLEVRVAPRAICINSKGRVAPGQEAEQALSTEQSFRRIYYVLDLPSEIDPERAAATLENGNLEIKLTRVSTGKAPVRDRAASA